LNKNREEEFSMPRKGARDMAKEQHWRSVLQKWRLSELTGAEFCRVHNFRYDQFQDWRKVIRLRDAEDLAEQRKAAKSKLFRPNETTPALGFVQAKIADVPAITPSATSDFHIEIVLACGTMLRVNSKCPTEFLMVILSALEERSC
jgi:hypothetical protein